MDSRDYMIKAFKYLAHERKHTQKEVAESVGENTNQLNEFLNKKRNFSEKKRERIAVFFGMTYIDMLILGKELEAISTMPPPPTEDELNQRIDERVNHILKSDNQPQDPIFSTDDLLSAEFQEQVIDLLYESVATQSTDEAIAETKSKVTREQRQKYIKLQTEKLKENSKLEKVNLKNHLEVFKLYKQTL